MKCLKMNTEYSFTEEESKKMEDTAETIISLIRGRKNLTYVEAEEVLRICEIRLKESLLE